MTPSRGTSHPVAPPLTCWDATGGGRKRDTDGGDVRHDETSAAAAADVRGTQPCSTVSEALSEPEPGAPPFLVGATRLPLVLAGMDEDGTP